MNTDSFWGDKVEYIEKLSAEVADLKNVLVELTSQVRRIERRIDLILPEGSKSKLAKPGAKNDGRAAKPKELTEAQVEQLVKRLKKRIVAREDIRAELRNMTVKYELTPIARYYGMTNTALPPKNKLVLNIITRLRQGVMLTENIHNVPRVAEEEKHFGN